MYIFACTFIIEMLIIVIMSNKKSPTKEFFLSSANGMDGSCYEKHITYININLHGFTRMCWSVRPPFSFIQNIFLHTFVILPFPSASMGCLWHCEFKEIFSINECPTIPRKCSCTAQKRTLLIENTKIALFYTFPLRFTSAQAYFTCHG